MIFFMVSYEFDTLALRDNFLGAVSKASISGLSEAEEGCHQYQYFKPVEKDNCLLLIEQWETMDHQIAHKKMPHFELVGQLKEQFGARVQVQVLECK